MFDPDAVFYTVSYALVTGAVLAVLAFGVILDEQVISGAGLSIQAPHQVRFVVYFRGSTDKGKSELDPDAQRKSVLEYLATR
jgi:hypothetical protein